jgi:hypothetical protein
MVNGIEIVIRRESANWPAWNGRNCLRRPDLDICPTACLTTGTKRDYYHVRAQARDGLKMVFTMCLT